MFRGGYSDEGLLVYTRVFGMMRGTGVMRGIGVMRMSSVIARMIQMILSCRRGIQGEDRKEGEVKGSGDECDERLRDH